MPVDKHLRAKSPVETQPVLVFPRAQVTAETLLTAPTAHGHVTLRAWLPMDAVCWPRSP